ncbi:MAG: RNA methyltransferase [Caldimicrobium sp.]|nr:RNA methyltransferase [Caldimicrobium sp.]MCX7873950.1 RNA methyltransferase [Caldimicrobium sp.]MDW8094211.1 RNA methyltransferase [Caldimicrobium sp.]
MRRIKRLEGEEILARWKRNRPDKRFPILLVLDNLRSAYNIGSIFRTAECAYLEGIILCGITAVPPHPGIAKTALGTMEKVPWHYEPSTLEAIENLKKRGYTIISLELTDKSIPIQSLSELSFPIALVIGNEVTGVDEKVLENSHFVVEIPLFGEKESLNVAVAAAVAIFLLINLGFPSRSTWQKEE